MSNMSIVNISLPGYNAGKYLRKSAESIHKQTNTSSELFIIDDGSTDGRIDFLIHVTDGRIYLMKRNHSYIATLNYGFSISCGKCIARMDFDNKMFPARSGEQVTVFEADKDIMIYVSYMKRMGGENVYDSGLRGTIGLFANILLLSNLIVYLIVIIRMDYLRTRQLNYQLEYIYAEGHKLWAEVACLGEVFYIISKSLLEYYISEVQVSCVHNLQQCETAGRIRNETLNFLIKNCLKRCVAHIEKLYNTYMLLNKDNLLDDDYIFYGFYQFFSRILADDEY